jgi:type VI secretion system secreted protein VgrG
LAVTTGENLSIASRGGVFASIRKGWRLFTYNAGLRLVAAANNIELKTLSGSIDMLAKISITETAETIDIAAKNQILVNAAGSYTRLNGSGIEHGTSGSFTVHRGSYAAAAGAAVPVDVDSGSTPFDEAFVLKHQGTNQVLANTRYRVKLASGKYEYGVTDKDGRTHLALSDKAGQINIEVGD